MNKKLVWGVGIVAAVAVLAVWSAKSRNAQPRTISVNGECLTTAPKDRTAITLRVTTLDKSAAESMKQATAKITQITSFLKTQDVKMQTTQFDSYEKTEWDRNAQKSIVLGIETNIAIEVSANNIETIENVLSQFAGQPNIYSENLRMFTSTEAMKPILEECLGTAVENARTRAGALAAGDKKRAGKMLAVAYDTNVQNVVRPTANFLRSASKEMAVMDAGVMTGGGIVAKDTEVSVTVSAVFEIK